MLNNRKSDLETIHEWLESLGLLTAGTMTANDAKVRCAAYASLLSDEIPTDAFTKSSLVFVASRCKFFPSFAEVSEHLGAWFRENLPAQQRLGSNPAVPGITHAPPDLRRPPPEECEYVADLVATFKAEVAANEFGRKIDVVPPGYLHGVNLAIARRNAGIPLSPDLQAILDQHEAGSKL